MKYLKAGLILLAIIIFLAIEQSLLADVTSSNNTSNNTSTSGNNTSIVGYEQQSTVNYNENSNPVTNSTTNSTTNNNNKTPAAPANAPSTQIYSSQSCTIAYSGALSTVTFGIAGSSYYHDPYCERRLLATTLDTVSYTHLTLPTICSV